MVGEIASAAPILGDSYELAKRIWQAHGDSAKEIMAIAEHLAAAPARVTRFEVIDETGRTYTRREVGIELSYQDEGRTLKVFVRAR